jgi:hypothetical protein
VNLSLYDHEVKTKGTLRNPDRTDEEILVAARSDPPAGNLTHRLLSSTTAST